MLLVTATAVPAAASPCLVPVPGIDDRCESWVAVDDNPEGDPEFGFDIARDVALAPGDATVVTAGASSNETWEEMDVALAARDASTGAERWRARYGGPGWDEPAEIAIADGRVLVAATLGGPEGEAVVLAFALATGELLWEALPATGGSERAAGIAAEGSEVYLAATTDAGGDQDILTVAYDAATGQERWRDTYDGPYAIDDGSDADTAEAITAIPGRVFVTGQSRGLSGDRADYDIVTIAYEAADEEHLGDRLWAERYDRAGLRDGPEAISVAPDGSAVYVGGFAGLPGYSGESAYENGAMLALALDAGSGTRLWQGLSGGDGLNWAEGIAADDERVYIAGTVSDPQQDRDRDLGIAAFHAEDGSLAWSRADGMPAHLNEGATDLALGAGRVYVTGASSPMTAPSEIVTLALAPDGAPVWAARWNSEDLPLSIDYGASVDASAAGAFVSATFWYRRASGNQYDIGTLAYR